MASRRSPLAILGLLLVFSCGEQDGSTVGDDDDDDDDDTAVGDDDDDDTPTGDTSAPGTPVVVTEAPTVTQPDPRGPLGRSVHLCTNVPSRVTLRVDDDEEPFEVGSRTPATCHDVPVLGLEPSHHYRLTATVIGPIDEVVVEVPPVDTAPLPTPFPDLEVVIPEPALVEPGVRFLPIDGDRNYVVGLDEQGEVVFLLLDRDAGDIDLLPNGHLLLQDSTLVLEVDLFGRVVASWMAGDQRGDGVRVDVPGFSHEVTWPGDGTMYTLYRVGVPVEGYPTNYQVPVPTRDTTAADNMIAQFDLLTGAVTYDLLIGDRLDRTRIGYDSLSFEFVGLDWGHANALQTLEDGGRFLVSLRNQDTTLMLRRDGTIEWMFAPEANWIPELAAHRLRPIGENFRQAYHQHATWFDPATGKLTMFDNGNQRASPYTDEVPLREAQSWARLVAYQVDETARTIAQTWSFDQPAEGRLTVNSRGDLEQLPTTGNYLANYATVIRVDGVALADLGRADPEIRLLEVSSDPVPVERMSVSFSSPLGTVDTGWNSYRTQFVAAPFPR